MSGISWIRIIHYGSFKFKQILPKHRLKTIAFSIFYKNSTENCTNISNAKVTFHESKDHHKYPIEVDFMHLF